MEDIQEMKQVSVSEILKEHNLVVPEIQREYVWGRNEYEILDTFLEDLTVGFHKVSDEDIEKNETIKNLLENVNETQKKVLLEMLNSNLSSNTIMNIGFLYSYKPNYYINDEGKDAYLIDGQQRFTTIFLILFYLAIKEYKYDEFIKLYRVKKEEGKIAFDYRVRSLTHHFMIDLIKYSKSIDDLKTITNKSWFLSNYKNDSTIKAIVGEGTKKGVFEIIDKHLKNEPDGYYDFVSQNIKFWHFKTEETSQGEELYITMNSRGQQLADNETIRAILFKSDIAKKNPIKWSTLWEKWQDYFWKNRSNTETNADKGFNEFLACIAGLENYLNKNGKIYSKFEFEKYNQISTKDIIKNLNLQTIETYFEAFEYINEEKENFIKNYNYSKWVEIAIHQINSIIFNNSTNWFAGHDDQNRATERNRMILIWSILLYYKKNKEFNRIKISDIFRILRIFYVRFNNNDRSVTSLNKDIDGFLEFGIFKAKLNYEEMLKNALYNRVKLEQLERYEETIWEIEDHKFNIDGKDVGNLNFSYLFDIEKIDSLDLIIKIKNKLYEVFPLERYKYLNIQNILLYYGEYFHRVTPLYYLNFQFDNWKKIIRDRDELNKPTRNVFNHFFNDFVNFEGSIEDFLKMLRKEKINKNDCKTLDQKFLWYNQYLINKMWEQGNYIAISIEDQYNALMDWYSNDKIFESDKIFYNTKGDLRGGSPIQLFSLLSEEQKKI